MFAHGGGGGNGCGGGGSGGGFLDSWLTFGSFRVRTGIFVLTSAKKKGRKSLGGCDGWFSVVLGFFL